MKITRDEEIQRLLSALKNSERKALARLITLIESSKREKKEIAQEVLRLCNSHKKSFKIGITGSPGVGKSSFIDRYGMSRIKEAKSVCALTVDPSSPDGHGSILGDKTRMENLSMHKNAFVRSTPSGNQLGGITDTSYDAIRLCEAYGFDELLIETVGVGQSEVDIAQISDMVIYLVQPASGDDLQAIKRGVLEIADLIIVHKADGSLLNAAEQSRKDFLQNANLLRPKYEGWKRPVVLFSSLTGNGLEELSSEIEKWKTFMVQDGRMEQKRVKQSVFWFERKVKKLILAKFFSNFDNSKFLVELSREIEENNMTVEECISRFRKKISL